MEPTGVKRKLTAIIVATVVLSACASPAVDTGAPMFDEAQYTVDLDTCRGGTALNAALHGLGGAVIGSAVGATQQFKIPPHQVIGHRHQFSKHFIRLIGNAHVVAQ